MKPRFLVIEGLIGVGKTTLCKILQEAWDARLVLEPWAENPFLASFYEDPTRFAFPAQMFYLASRYRQQQNIRQTDLFQGTVVADYLFEKDRIFAEQTLAGDELELYDQFAGLLGENLPSPDLVIFLDAPTDTILSRIATRAISAEQKIQPEYLDALRDRYYRLWKGYTAAPVKVLHTTDIDYVNDPEAREDIVGMVQRWLDGHDLGPPASASTEWEGQPSLFGTRSD
mgnify:CR=1 FL=1